MADPGTVKNRFSLLSCRNPAEGTTFQSECRSAVDGLKTSTGEINGTMFSVNTRDSSVLVSADVQAGNCSLAGEENALQPQTSQSALLSDKYMEVVVAAQLECLKFKTLLHSCSDEEGTHADLPASVQIGTKTCEESSSDSDTDSDSSSSLSISNVLSEDDDDADQQARKEGKASHAVLQDELLLEELPLVEDLTIILPENVDVKPIGRISSIIEQLVIIESLKDIPPLREGSIIFKEDGCAIGRVFEIFGPVSHPFYMLRFKSSECIDRKRIFVHDITYFAPSMEDFTKYLFVDQLKQQRGSDASWMNDQEPPEEALDFSDDEQEKKAKQMRKQQNQGKSNKSEPREARSSGGDQQSSAPPRNNPSKASNPRFPNKTFVQPSKKVFQDPVVPVRPTRRARPALLPSPLYPPTATLMQKPQGFPQTQGGINPVMQYYSVPPSDYRSSYYEIQDYLPPDFNMGWPTHNIHPQYLQGNSFPHSLIQPSPYLPPPPPPPPPTG